jgi:hypothetical protein
MFAELAIELWRRDTILQKVKRMAHLVCRDLIQFSGLEVDHALNRLVLTVLVPAAYGPGSFDSESFWLQVNGFHMHCHVCSGYYSWSA